eukprot:11979426-Alexandrium_andersonii.AAC.1
MGADPPLPPPALSPRSGDVEDDEYGDRSPHSVRASPPRHDGEGAQSGAEERGGDGAASPSGARRGPQRVTGDEPRAVPVESSASWLPAFSRRLRLPAGEHTLADGPPRVPPLFAQAAVTTLAPVAVLAAGLDRWIAEAPPGWDGATLLPADAGGRERAIDIAADVSQQEDDSPLVDAGASQVAATTQAMRNAGVRAPLILLNAAVLAAGESLT